jgi:hypothetical protein
MTVAVRPQPMSGRYQFHVRVDLEANLGFVTGTREEFGEARRDEWPTPPRRRRRARLTALELPRRPQFVAEERVRRRLTALGGRTHCAGFECDRRRL